MKTFKIGISFTNRDDLSIRLYFKDINKFKPLTPEEETELFIRIENGDRDAFVKIIKHNLRFVITVAKQYQGQGLPLVDLINEGNIGLCTAVSKFDYTRGFKFISYAVWWIRQSIIQAIYNTGRTIRFPIPTVSKLNKLIKVSSTLESKLEREATIEELAKETDFTEEKVEDLIKYNNTCSSMDMIIDEDNNSTIGDLIPSYVKSDDDLIIDSDKKELNKIISNLPNRNADIIRMFFGIGMQALSLEEIGLRFGMSGERIRQLREEGLEILRSNYSEELKELLCVVI